MKVQVTENLKKSLVIAQNIAIKYSNPEIGTEHILYGLATNNDTMVSKLLAEYGVDIAEIESIFAREDHVVLMGEPELSSRMNRIIFQAYRLGAENGAPQASCAGVLLCILTGASGVAYNFLHDRVDIVGLENALANSLTSDSQGADDSVLPEQLRR